MGWFLSCLCYRGLKGKWSVVERFQKQQKREKKINIIMLQKKNRKSNKGREQTKNQMRKKGKGQRKGKTD